MHVRPKHAQSIETSQDMFPGSHTECLICACGRGVIKAWGTCIRHLLQIAAGTYHHGTSSTHTRQKTLQMSRKAYLFIPMWFAGEWTHWWPCVQPHCGSIAVPGVRRPWKISESLYTFAKSSYSCAIAWAHWVHWVRLAPDIGPLCRPWRHKVSYLPLTSYETNSF